MLQQFERVEQTFRDEPLSAAMPPAVRLALLTALGDGPQAVALFDPKDTLVYANQVFRDAWSIPPAGTVTFDTLIRRCHSERCGALIETDDVAAWIERAQKRRRGGAPLRSFEVDFCDGRWFWVGERRLADGWLVMIANDITQLKNSERRLSVARDAAVQTALTDPLTHLPNRRRATEQIEGLLDRNASFSIALLDLVHFKQINDSYGHAVGDGVLIEFARRLLATIGRTSMAARLAGDEFAVIGGPGLSPSTFRLLMLEAVERQRVPFEVLGHVLHVGLSIGIASAPTDATKAGELLSAADDAMYRAKQAGRYSLKVFDTDMGRERREQAALRRDLAAAFAKRQFVPYYQPVVDLNGGALIKFEMLARWAHPKRGILAPDRFLPVFSSSDQWNQLTLQLLRQAGADFAGINPFPRIAFNVSSHQLKQESIVSLLEQIRSERVIPLENLEMEVTESALISNPSEAQAAVDAVRQMGLSTALDDFGVGFSSLKHLREIAFDRLKLDRSFVQGISDNKRSQVFVGAIIDLARKLGLTVIVEGVEDVETADTLARLGCDYGQGYLYGRPAPADAARARVLDGASDGAAATDGSALHGGTTPPSSMAEAQATV